MIPGSLKALPRDIRFIARYLLAVKELNPIQRNNKNVGQVFDSVAKQIPNNPCFYYEDDVWTYKRVEEASNRIGNYYSAQGFKKGQIVSVFMGNRIEIILTWLGLSKIGVVPALVNFNLTSNSLKHSVETVNPSAIICGYELSEALRNIYPDGNGRIPIFGSGAGDRQILRGAIDTDSDINKVSPLAPQPSSPVGFTDDLFYIYTSGTTGLPKAAVIKQSRFFFVGFGLRRILGIRQNDILYTTFPLIHTAGGIIAVGFPLLFGIPLVIRKKFKASEFWKDCVKHKVTVAQYMGETCRYLMKQPVVPEETAHSIRTMFGNGLRPELWMEFKERFQIPLIQEMYGATEGNCNIFNMVGKHGSVGFVPPLLQRVWPINLIKLDENDEPLRDPKTGLAIRAAVGEAGELVGKIIDGQPIREYHGYVGNKKESDKKIVRDVYSKGDKFFRTGDVLKRDSQGFYYFQDRIGDSFRWKSENVSTTQVEDVLSSITKLKDLVVYPVKIPGTEGSAGMAAIADPENHIDLNSYADEIKKSLPKYSIPLFFRKVKEIQFTETHKPKKYDLKRQGYDLAQIGDDKILFFNNGKFVPLTEELVKSINTGKISL